MAERVNRVTWGQLSPPLATGKAAGEGRGSELKPGGRTPKGKVGDVTCLEHEA